MKFSLIIFAIAQMIKISLSKDKYLRDMIKNQNVTYLMVTKDGKRGRRFMFNNGTFSSDKTLSEYDLAYVWKDDETAFKVLTSKDVNGIDRAIANWDLQLVGDKILHAWFSIFLGYATGMFKRK